MIDPPPQGVVGFHREWGAYASGCSEQPHPMLLVRRRGRRPPAPPPVQPKHCARAHLPEPACPPPHSCPGVTFSPEACLEQQSRINARVQVIAEPKGAATASLPQGCPSRRCTAAGAAANGLLLLLFSCCLLTAGRRPPPPPASWTGGAGRPPAAAAAVAAVAAAAAGAQPHKAHRSQHQAGNSPGEC